MLINGVVIISKEREKNEEKYKGRERDLESYYKTMISSIKKYCDVILFPDDHKVIEGAPNRVVVEKRRYSKVVKILKKHGFDDFIKSHTEYDELLKVYHIGLPELPVNFIYVK